MTGIERLEKQLVEALRRHLADGGRAQLPEAGRLLWRAFVELDATRTMHAHGPNPIPYSEIEGWARINGYPLQPHHVGILKAMDAAMIEHFHNSQGGDERRAVGNMSPKMFDALLG